MPTSPAFRAKLALSAATVAALLASACGDDEAAAPRDAGADAPSLADAGLPVDPSASAPSMDGSISAPTIDASAPGGDAGTASGDPLDKHQSFQLDCASLPANGTCQGGPREVLLATNLEGLVAMLDPEDGHFLGYLKHASFEAVVNGYTQATQGPDQCIWTVLEQHRDDLPASIQRWNTDGSFRDDIIPRGKHFRGELDRAERPSSLAFSREHVYVASSNGSLSDDLKLGVVSRFKLDGSFDGDALVGPIVHSLLVLGDGSLLTSGEKAVEHWPAGGGMPRAVLTKRAAQLWYAGRGEVLTSTEEKRGLQRVSIETGLVAPERGPGEGHAREGVAQLGNGRWLTGDDGLQSIGPKTSLPDDVQPIALPSDARIAESWGHFGRACLPTEVVERAQKIAPPVTDCEQLPPGAPLVEESFESGAFTGTGEARAFKGWREGVSGQPPAVIAAATAGNATSCLQLLPNHTYPEQTSVVHELTSAAPSYVGFRARVDGDGMAMFFLYGIEAINIWDTQLTTDASNIELTLEAGSWVRVQMRNIDWKKRTYDLYVNCERVGTGVPFRPEALGSLSRIGVGLYTVSDMGPAYFDDIVVR